MGRARFLVVLVVFDGKSPHFHDQQRLGKLSLNTALIDPCDEALPFSQESSHFCTTSSFDFWGE